MTPRGGPSVRWQLVGANTLAVVAAGAAIIVSFSHGMPPVALVATLAVLVAALLLSTLVTASIARRLRSISLTAEAIARGEGRKPLPPGRFDPPELGQLVIALGRVAKQLEQRTESVSEFATHVTHELKTPLTAIRGAAELLRESRREMSNEQFDRFINNIDEDATRMERMVSRLLDLARMGNPLPESIEIIDVQFFFGEIGQKYAGQIDLQVTNPPAKLPINAMQLRAAVCNLIDNAIRHGAGKPVEVRVSGDDGRIRVEVQDYGPGISKANQTRLFQPFFTTERKRGGTGLGLAIVKAVADSRDGAITYETGPQGTTFTLLL